MRGPERKAQLLTVARKVFGAKGFHGVSMETEWKPLRPNTRRATFRS